MDAVAPHFPCKFEVTTIRIRFDVFHRRSSVRRHSDFSPPPTMSLLLNPNPSSTLLSHKFPKFSPKSLKPSSLSFSSSRKSIVSVRSSYSFDDPTEPPSKPDASSENPAYVDEWGEKTEPDPQPTSRFSGSDPPKDDDEWGEPQIKLGNGSPVAEAGVSGSSIEEDEKLRDLKRALVDTVYGSDFGFRASPEIRAETLELVSQLEAVNPIPAPTESPELLDGNWVLVYTASSELLPLLAAGNIPSVKVEKISQSIDTSSNTIENFITLSNPVSTLSFSASASFEVQSPSRIQVEFKQGTFKPPEIKSRLDLPENFSLFGLNINLSPVQQFIGPLQNALEAIGRTISGQPPLKVPIPGGQSKSWLLTTYLDYEFRISRGDGGLFVLVKEGSPLLY